MCTMLACSTVTITRPFTSNFSTDIRAVSSAEQKTGAKERMFSRRCWIEKVTQECNFLTTHGGHKPSHRVTEVKTSGPLYEPESLRFSLVSFKFRVNYGLAFFSPPLEGKPHTKLKTVSKNPARRLTV